LRHKALPALADQDEEAGQVGVSHPVLAVVGVGRVQDHLVSQGLSRVSHAGSEKFNLGLVWGIGR
jgi:hypothetical protein